jgi:hypothetical protein
MTADAWEQVVSTSRAGVFRVEDRHAPAVAAFMREAWGEEVPPERLRKAWAAAAAANPIAPGEEPPSFIFLDGDRVLGNLGTIPVRLWCRGAEEPAHWLKGLMVVPSHRNGPVGFYLLKEATRQLGCAMALVVELGARRLFLAHGFADLGAIPNYLKILEPERVLRQLDIEALGLSGLPRALVWGLRTAQLPGISTLAGGVLAGALRLCAAGAGTRAGGAAVQTEKIPRDDLDPLWRRVRIGVRAAVARDGAYVERRYGRREAEKYRFVTVGETVTSGGVGGLSGLGAIRAPRAGGDPRLKGIRVAVLSEILFPIETPEVGLSVLAAAEDAARDLGADCLLCTGSHSSLQPLLKRRAFMRLPGNVHFLVRHPAGQDHLPRTLGEWWLTRGDSDADEVF